MAEPMHTVPVPPAGSEEVYRPLSGLAILGLIAAVVFFVLMLLSIGVALLQGAPLFLGYGFMLMPLVAAVLSFLGRRQILLSEGTRAGLGLANWGLWLSILCGLGYFAYVFFTGLALTQQANAFLLTKDKDAGFFPHVLAGELNQAFLLTRPPYHRSGNPNNEDQMVELYDQPMDGTEFGGGDLSMFRNHWLIRAIAQGGKDATSIEPLGVQSWKYEKKGYHVLRNYRITTQEVVAEVILPVQSSEAAEPGQPRRWHLAYPQLQKTNASPTPLGMGLKKIRESGRVFLNQWLEKLNQGQAFDAFEKMDQTNWNRLVAKELLRQYMRTQATQAFISTKADRLRYQWSQDGSAPNLTPWKRLEGGRLEVAENFQLMFPTTVGNFPPFALDCRVTLQSPHPLDPLQPPQEVAWEIKEMQMIRVMTRRAIDKDIPVK